MVGLRSFSDRTVSLKEVFNWAAYRNFAGPSPEQIARLEATPPVRGRFGHEVSARCAREEEAHTEVLVALRDGRLRARGRLSTERNWSHLRGGYGFVLHSGKATDITPDTWKGGRYNPQEDALQCLESEHIDVTCDVWLVEYLWHVEEEARAQAPTPPPAPPPVDDAEEVMSRTAYGKRILEGFRQFWRKKPLSVVGQPADWQGPTEKKDEIVAWFMAKPIEGEPLSRHLAEAFATAVRPLEAQMGGARRASDPLPPPRKAG